MSWGLCVAGQDRQTGCPPALRSHKAAAAASSCDNVAIYRIHLIPVRTRPLADTAYYPPVDVLSAGGFVARWRATREGTADHHQVTENKVLLITPHIHKTASTMLKSVESVDAAAAGSGAAVSLELASRFRLLAGLSRQQQQGRPALQQRLASICAQHKHGGAPHATCTTVQCQNHSQGQTVHWGVTHSGVTRHRAVICVGARRGNAPSRGQTLWHPAAHIDSRTRTQTCTARATVLHGVERHVLGVAQNGTTRHTAESCIVAHSVETRLPGKVWHPA